MTPLTDQFGNTIAYLYKKMLIDPNGQNVLGLIIGNCVFGNRSEPVGKFFNNIIRDTDGRITAKLVPDSYVSSPHNETDLINATWRILMQIKSHVCSWIPELSTWSDKNLTEVLAENEKTIAYQVVK